MEAVAVIAGIVGLVWGTVVICRGGLLGGCLAVLLAGACFSVPFFKLEIGPVPLTIDRVLLVLLVVQYVFWRRWGWADPKPLGKPEVLLLAFTAVMVVSTFTADWTALNYQPVSWLIIYYLMPVTVYWIARQTKFSERAMLAVFGCFAVFGVVSGRDRAGRVFSGVVAGLSRVHRHHGGGEQAGVHRPRPRSAAESDRQRHAAGHLSRPRRCFGGRG